MRVRRTIAMGWLLIVIATVACGGAPGAEESRAGAGSTSIDRAITEAGRPTDQQSRRPRIVVLGDSLTAGLGLPADQAFPAILQQLSDAEGLDYEVVNAGVSGDTSAGGVRRLDWALAGDVRVLVVALGGNDGLRGVPPEELRRNLATIVEQAQARGVSVVLAGMEAPPNLGPAYTAAFRRVYADLAEQYELPLVPFLLDGVAGVAALNQRDGIHPNAEGAELVAELVWPVLQPVAVERQRDSPAAP